MKRLLYLVLFGLTVGGLLLPGAFFGVGSIHEGHEGFPSRDNRSGHVAPTLQQQQIADGLGATVSWN